MNLKNIFKRKSVQTIDTPDKLHAAMAELMAAYQSHTGVTVTSDTAMRVSTVFACIRVLAESVGMLPVKLYEEVNGQKSVASTHNVNYLLSRKPNGYMTPQEFKELIMYCLCTNGNFYALKTVVRGEVRELLPLQPNAVEAKLNEDWEPIYKVHNTDGTKTTHTQEEIFHVRLFSKNGLNGISPIAFSRESIGLSLAAQEQGARWFKEGVAPSGVLSTEQGLSDSAFERLQEEFKKNSVGLSNSSKPIILEHGLKWLATSLNAQDIQFLETRKFQRDEICAIFRVPPHMVANLDRATFNNVEHHGISFVNHSLVPYLTRIEERANISLLSRADQLTHFIKFNTAALLRGDIKTRFTAYQIAITNGIMSPNEARDFEDWNPREGGDEYLTPMNMNSTQNPENENQNDEN